ncbi:MAG: 2'-5' RNA ligase family protein [Ilumatobacteraceae bacterium]|nr:2'-5' RNA ligase family protein [Ilumatobacteraceae bacterium]
MTRSALVVLVPEAEPLVAEHRVRHDRMAARGVPAHVTILHPFRSTVDPATADEVAAIAQTFQPFDATLTTVDRFPGDLVFLTPQPTATFRTMLRTVAAAFPDCPPYGGAHPDPAPHLTVGNGVSVERADELTDQLSRGLPIHAHVDRWTLLVEDDDRTWTVDRHWPLGAR